MNGTIKACYQILVSLFKHFESCSLFCSNSHSLYFSRIMVTMVMARAMNLDFSQQSTEGRLSQGHSKVFTAGQARVNPEHYVINCVGG